MVTCADKRVEAQFHIRKTIDRKEKYRKRQMTVRLGALIDDFLSDDAPECLSEEVNHGTCETHETQEWYQIGSDLDLLTRNEFFESFYSEIMSRIPWDEESTDHYFHAPLTNVFYSGPGAQIVGLVESDQAHYLRGYIEYLITFFDCSRSIFIAGLVYLNRIEEVGGLKLCKRNVYRLLFTALMLGVKWLDDDYYSPSYFRKLARVASVDEYVEMENYFLEKYNWMLTISKGRFYHEESKILQRVVLDEHILNFNVDQ